MAHCQERGWFYIIRIRDGRQSIKSRLILPDTPCFDETIHLNLCRKQTKEMKQVYQDLPNQFRFLPSNVTFDFLPKYNHKKEPTICYRLDFRIVRIEIAKGQYETLVTNTDYPPSTLKELYASRWSIETRFRDLKYSMGLVHFHAKKKEGILQEIFARFIDFNFCQWLTSLIAIHKPKSRYDYQICFSDASYACLRFLRGVITSFQLETFIAKHLSIIRPNRQFPRKIKTQAAVSFTYRVP